jgi:hypothetical protein
MLSSFFDRSLIEFAVGLLLTLLFPGAFISLRRSIDGDRSARCLPPILCPYRAAFVPSIRMLCGD